MRSSSRKSVRSVSAWNKSSERRRRGSTRSVCASWRSRSGSSVPVSRRLRSANAAVKRRERAPQRRKPSLIGVRRRREDGGGALREVIQTGVVLCLTGTGDKRVVRETTGRTERCPSGEEMVHAGAEMIEDPVGALMMIEVHVVVVMMTVLYVEEWMMTEVHAEALMMTAVQEGVAMMTVAQGVALMMIAVPGVALMTTEVHVEAWMTPGVSGVGLMMTGAGEETMTEVEEEVWMTDPVVVVMTPNPGSPSADLVVGVSGRKPGRRAGVLLVVVPRMTMMMMEREDPVTASGTVLHPERRTPGGERAQTKGAIGEVLAERTLTVMIAAMIVVTEMIAVTVKIAVVTVVIETAVMMNREAHPESRMREAPGAVEVISGKNGTGTSQGSVTVTLREIGPGVLTKKTLVALRTRQMMMAGLLSAAESQRLHPIGSVNDELVLKNMTTSF